MSPEREYQSTGELFQAELSSNKAGEMREYLPDIHQFLRLERIICEFKFDPNIPKDIPLLALPNHYIRPLLMRRSPFTTIDSMTACGLALRGLDDITNRKTRWVSKTDLSEKIFGFIPSTPRKAQNAMTSVYGNIPAIEGQFETIPKEIEQTLREGLNVGIYPEGEPTSRLLQVQLESKLRIPPKRFAGLIAHLKRKKVDYLILPISIYSNNDGYHVTFGRTIDPNSAHPRQVVDKTMVSIASNLPPHLRGPYQDITSLEVAPR